MNCKLLTALLLTLLFVFQQPAVGKCNGGKAQGDIFRNWTLTKLPNFTTEQINTIGTITVARGMLLITDDRTAVPHSRSMSKTVKLSVKPIKC